MSSIVIAVCSLAIAVYLMIAVYFVIQVRQMRRTSRTYRPYEFVEVDSLLHAGPIRRQFERHTPLLLEMGFDLIGDYRLKPKPVEVHDRLFLSPDRETLAAICAVLGSGAVSLISVLDDGMCVHTTCTFNPHPERTLDPADRLWISYVPEAASVQDLHQHHLDTLRKLSAETDSRALRFRREQFREVLNYDQLVFCRWRFRHGGLDHEPPEPDYGSLQIRRQCTP
jgi:hypothetical protein